MTFISGSLHLEEENLDMLLVTLAYILDVSGII